MDQASVSIQTKIFWYEIRGNAIKHNLFDTSVLIISMMMPVVAGAMRPS